MRGTHDQTTTIETSCKRRPFIRIKKITSSTIATHALQFFFLRFIEIESHTHTHTHKQCHYSSQADYTLYIIIMLNNKRIIDFLFFFQSRKLYEPIPNYASD